MNSMKLISTTLVLSALFIAPAVADETYQSTLSGTLTVQPVSPQPAEGSAKPPATETLTLHVVHPAADAEDSGEAELRDLEACGARWNAKLKDYKAKLAQSEGYRTYFDKWEDFPAQRPPKLPLPILTRASYRACMAECLGEPGAICPGGWPEEKK